LIADRPRGVFAAALTPLRDDLSPDPQALLRHCRWLIAQGCDGVLVLGTTGEASSFSVEERLLLIDALGGCELAPRVIVGTGCCAVPDTVRLTRRAVEVGAAGVLVLPPFYYKRVTDEGLFASYAAVIDGVDDDRLRLYVYHFPQMTGLQIGLPLLQRLRAAYGRVVVGLKNSSGDLEEMAAMARALPGFDVFTGTEEHLLAMLRLGGAGCISATINVLAPHAAALHARWQRAEAEPLQRRLAELRRVVDRAGAIAALRAILARRLGDPAWENLRPPLCRLPAETADALVAELETAGCWQTR
jgi:4-hydroxy-tetrahydrodipicolinate synthase